MAIADIVDSATRSRMMSRIGSKNTRPELILRRALHSMGFRYRLHTRDLPGKPDLVFPRHRAVCFVHGCFWHQHSGCGLARIPKTRTDFWEIKFKQNVERDRRHILELQENGWRTAVIWECHLQNNNLDMAVESLASWLIKNKETVFYESRCQGRE